MDKTYIRCTRNARRETGLSCHKEGGESNAAGVFCLYPKGFGNKHIVQSEKSFIIGDVEKTLPASFHFFFHLTCMIIGNPL